GAESNWDAYMSSFVRSHPEWMNNPNMQEIVWRSRAKNTPALLAQLLGTASEKDKEKLFRSFDFQDPKTKNKALFSLLENTKSTKEKIMIFKHFDKTALANNTDFKAKVRDFIAQVPNSPDFLDIVERLELTEERKRLMEYISSSEDGEVTKRIANVLALYFGISPLQETIANKKLSQEEKSKLILKLSVGNESSAKVLIRTFQDAKQPLAIRKAAVLAMQSYNTDVILWKLMQVNKIAPELMPEAKIVLSRTFHSDLKTAFEHKYPVKIQANSTNNNLGFLHQKSNAIKGKELFSAYCSTCHKIGKEGSEFGPSLGQIGAKLSKGALYAAIQNPSQAISFGYETSQLNLVDGTQIQGIITSKNGSNYMLKQPGTEQLMPVAVSKVKSKETTKTSMMPAFTLSQEEYRDLIGYLSGLK
ncbi:MAG: c-type cytochrome, partial [Leadbetterella sp.]